MAGPGRSRIADQLAAVAISLCRLQCLPEQQGTEHNCLRRLGEKTNGELLRCATDIRGGVQLLRTVIWEAIEMKFSLCTIFRESRTEINALRPQFSRPQFSNFHGVVFESTSQRPQTTGEGAQFLRRLAAACAPNGYEAHQLIVDTPLTRSSGVDTLYLLAVEEVDHG